MSFDPLVTNPGRLRILTALAAEPIQPFVALRRRTGLTDGNLATHARRLQSAGFLTIEKSIASGKPLTTLHLTHQGRAALTAHATALMAALAPAPSAAPLLVSSTPVENFTSLDSADASTDASDDWVD
jgi:DNA-binding MarR family transcriptional regulator